MIPEFVLVELRHIADSSDALKRNRGRRGLDILKKIQTEYGIEIYNTTAEKALDEIPEVDVKLLKLAQIMNGKVVTNDFNLNKVAGIKGVEAVSYTHLDVYKRQSLSHCNTGSRQADGLRSISFISPGCIRRSRIRS